MTITLQAVNELIQSLESAGELSIKERKYLDLAKAYADKEAESVAQALTFEKCRELTNCPAGVDLQDWVKQLQAQIAELESRTVTVKLPEGDERDDLVISITEEIAHLQRCVERYKKEEMASTTQEMEQRLLVQQIALSVLNSAAGIKWEGE